MPQRKEKQKTRMSEVWNVSTYLQTYDGHLSLKQEKVKSRGRGSVRKEEMKEPRVGLFITQLGYINSSPRNS